MVEKNWGRYKFCWCRGSVIVTTGMVFRNRYIPLAALLSGYVVHLTLAILFEAIPIAFK